MMPAAICRVFQMTEPGECEAVAWRTLVQVRELVKHARSVGLDTMAYLLDMVALEAGLHVTLKSKDFPEQPG
jgi:hypothetical protein